MSNIPNPPVPPNGHFVKWNGDEWEFVKFNTKPMPPKPQGVPDGYRAEWTGDEWVIVKIPEPPPPPKPTNKETTQMTINRAVGCLQMVDYLSTEAVNVRLTKESRKLVSDYVDSMVDIIATAQTKFAADEAYAPDFPPTPMVSHQARQGDSVAVINFTKGG